MRSPCSLSLSLSLSVHINVCVCACACVRACACVCVCVLSLPGNSLVNTFSNRYICNNRRTVEWDVFYAVCVISNTQYIVKGSR
jgi:hypothetical protein